jgi:hypothetical protein
LLSDSGLQRCVADFDGHVWLPGFKGTRKSGAIQQNPGEMASWCPLAENSGEWGSLDRGGRAGNGKLGCVGQPRVHYPLEASLNHWCPMAYIFA